MNIKLKDIASVTMGQSPKSEYYNSNGIGTPFLQGNRTFGFKYPYYDTYTSCVKKKALKGDIIMSVRAPVGDLNFAPTDLCIGRGLCSIRAKDGNDQDYLYYLLKYMMPNIVNKQSGTVFGSINNKDINNLDLNIHNFKEQKQISRILSTIDEKISYNNKINDNLHEQCSCLYNKLVEAAPEGKLADVIEFVETGARPKGGAENNGVPSIGAEKIERFGIYDYSTEKYINESFFEKMKRGKIQSGDVLLYKDGAYTGKSSMCLNAFPYEKAAVNEHVFLIRSKNKSMQSFVYYSLQNDKIHKKIYALACGKAAQPGLNQQELLSVECRLPSISEILEFEKEVEPIMNRIAINALQNQKLSELRDTLLPKLMNGEIDVSNIKLD